MPPIRRTHSLPAALLALFLLNIPALSFSATPPAPFRAGESLKYQIRWLGMPIATARLSVEEKDRRALRLRGRLKTTGLLKRLLRVDDTALSHADPVSLSSRRIEFWQKEGRYRARRWNVFEKGRALYGRPGRPPRYFEIAGRVHDILSGIYRARSLDLRPGGRATINIFHNKKRYRIRLRALAAESIETLWGPVRTVVVRPEFFDNPYLEGLAKTWIYLAADRHRVPVRLETKTYLGPFTAHLIESRGVASGPLSGPPLRKLKGWKAVPRRVEKGRSGGLGELKRLLNISRIKRQN
jgi:hypothetical protein